MNLRRRLILVSLFTAGAASCGGGNAAPGNVDEFINRFYGALCTMQVACGDMPDKPTCLTSLQLGACP